MQPKFSFECDTLFCRNGELGIIHEENKEERDFLLQDDAQAYTQDVSLFFGFPFILILLPFMDSDFFFSVFIVESRDKGVAADLQHTPKTFFVGVHGCVYFHFMLVHMQHCTAFCKIKHCGSSIKHVLGQHSVHILVVNNHSRSDLYLSKDMCHFWFQSLLTKSILP